MVPPSSIVVAHDGQASCSLGDVAVVFSLNRGMYYGLYPVAALIWRRVQQPVRVVGVRDTVLEIHRAERERAERNLPTFLNELATERFFSRPPFYRQATARPSRSLT